MLLASEVDLYTDFTTSVYEWSTNVALLLLDFRVCVDTTYESLELACGVLEVAESVSEVAKCQRGSSPSFSRLCAFTESTALYVETSLCVC